MSKLTYILSQPRSGSTVLTAILDKRKGVVCMPESSFPQVLGVISKKERADKRWLAALYLGARFPPGPLKYDDALACMDGSDDEILFSLGKAVAAKLGRDPEQITNVVWKTTRTIGMHAGPLATEGKFVVLRRNIHNVFESQSRFDYGASNRNPYRYAIFTQSYEHALRRCPKGRTFQLNYDDLPGITLQLLEFMGVENRGEWETQMSVLDIVAENCSWLTEVTKEFKNTDPEKRARLDSRVVRKLDLALALTTPVRPFIGPVRSYFDKKSMMDINKSAHGHLAKNQQESLP